MDTTNVLLMIKLDEPFIRKIAASGPGIKVVDASPLMNARPFSGSGVKDAAAEEKLNALFAEAEVIFGFRALPGMIANSPKLKWIQIFSAGAEHILSPEVINSPVIVTNTSGMHAVPITETVFGMMLMFAKHLPQCLENQKTAKWEHFTPASLTGQTLGIVGYGSIGQELARIGKAFGMRVVATRRSAKEVSRARNVDVLYPREQLGKVLAESDYLVLAVPSTAETLKMIGEKEFRQMEPTAFFINIGRGNTVDEEALIRALQEKRIAGAGLDTFVREPLPPESPLWKMSNVYITPHVSGIQADVQNKATDIFCDNLKRYTGGKPLKNVVNKQKGY